MSLKDWKGPFAGRGEDEAEETASPAEALEYWIKVERNLSTMRQHLAYMSPETEELTGLVDGTEEAIDELRTRALAYIGRYTTLIPAAPAAHEAPMSQQPQAPQPMAAHTPYARQGAMPAWNQAPAHAAPAHGAPPAGVSGGYAAHEVAAHGEPGSWPR